MRPHCRECCSPTIPSHLVGRSSGFVGLLSVVGVWCCSSHWAHRETTPHDILYDTNPPPQPLAKTCVVLGVCQTPTRWVTYIRSPTQNPSTHACVHPGGWWMLIFLLCENSIAYQVLHTPTLLVVVWVSHTPTLVVVGCVALVKRYTLETLFLFCFCFVCAQHTHGVLWLESLILAQDERWRRA